MWRQMWEVHYKTKQLLLGGLPGVMAVTDFEGMESGNAFDVYHEYGRRNKVGMVLGPLLFLLILLSPTPAGLEWSAHVVAASTVWIAVWWMTEALPIPITALLPILLFPAVGGLEIDQVTMPYADPLIFLFLGGFFIAMAMQRWDLHRRIALHTLRFAGESPRRMILAFMVATAFLSMWVSNTATAMMMVPIGIAVIIQTRHLLERHDGQDAIGEFRFASALMMGIAYSASVGGVATLIGSPPNIVFAGAVSELYGIDISFTQWMMYGLPVAVIGLIIVFVYLTYVKLPPRIAQIPAGQDVVREELSGLGVFSRQERLVLAVFLLVAAGWILRPHLLEVLGSGHITDPMIAIGGAILLFVIPARTQEGEFTFLLDWQSAVDIPWGIVLLFGGGMSIASAFEDTGLATWLGDQLLVLDGVPFIMIIAGICLITVVLTEVTSNTATAAMLMPVLASLAVGIGVHPYVLMIAGATAASFAFMLPVATPPNAIVFGSGHLRAPTMAHAGVWLNIIGVILITVIVAYYVPVAWGIEPTTVPGWAQ